MGLSSSTPNRGRNYYNYAQNQTLPPPPPYSGPQPSTPPASAPTSQPPQTPPPLPPPSSSYPSPPPYNVYSPQATGMSFAPMIQGRSGYYYHPAGSNAQGRGWWPSFAHHPGYSGYAPSPSNRAPPPAAYPMQQQYRPYVKHEEAKRVKNDVNVHKETVQLVQDQDNPDQHLVSFTFDANFDGSLIIFYFAKEDINDGSLTPVYPEVYKPVRLPFQMGSGQKFCQPSGSGVNLRVFELSELANPSQGNAFPLVICAEASVPSKETGKLLDRLPTRSQFTEAIIHKKGDGPFQVKVIRQILWIDGQRFELQNIFGLEDKEGSSINDEDTGKDCVICLSEPRDTAVFPCWHMCMCGQCARALTYESNRCPICRQPVEKLVEIKVNSDEN